jgi:hypothetical protein
VLGELRTLLLNSVYLKLGFVLIFRVESFVLTIQINPLDTFFVSFKIDGITNSKKNCRRPIRHIVVRAINDYFIWYVADQTHVQKEIRH